MSEEYTCIECENLYDERDGDTDERLCDKCGCQIYEEPTTADEFNKPYLEEKNRNDKLLKYLSKRLEMGQIKYGKSIPRDDGREWVKEALEEILDAMVYVGNVLLTIQEDKENG
jgi:hypothetical protein